ncbi:SRPBCC domain-containing protein [Synoicihabitans lomoniglobus]|uniref:SRPBCC domain-containing protein n=1 Tax=Synoicihabitans lomoniglobus TaxID=2909285 RepID=A0AAE9ZZ21_9BACT|nr:SRPBCC domain-containing protein [Opitutaceae bacterium LMO-M01]WED65318.1 SRPBCC domain-containing protein [Opitutaceae bacterium LMO-M01]
MSELKKAVFKVHIAAPIERVWAAITKEGEVLPFFYNSVMHTPSLAPGSALRMRSLDEKYTAVVGDILVVEPPSRFSHTMKFTQYADDPASTVTYELTAKDGGTELLLLLDNVPVGTKSEGYMMAGGLFITQTIKDCVETGRPNFKNRLFLGMIGLFGFMTPKLCRTENWPFEKKVS